jgi:hypothetical protein
MAEIRDETIPVRQVIEVVQNANEAMAKSMVFVNLRRRSPAEFRGTQDCRIADNAATRTGEVSDSIAGVAISCIARGAARIRCSSRRPN